MLWHTMYQLGFKQNHIYIYLYMFINYYIYNYKDLNLLYCGSWLRGLSEDVQLFLCLALAPASTGSWEKKMDVKQGKQRQAG